MNRREATHLDISTVNTETQETTISDLSIIGYEAEFGKPSIICLTNSIGEDGDEVHYINIPTDKVKLVAETMLDSIPHIDLVEHDGEATPHQVTTKLSFDYYRKHQMGRGFVGFQPSVDNQLDLNVFFVHEDSESSDVATIEAVEKDCAELVRLLQKFHISNEFITERAKACGISGAEALSRRVDVETSPGVLGANLGFPIQIGEEDYPYVEICRQAHLRGSIASCGPMPPEEKESIYKTSFINYIQANLSGKYRQVFDNTEFEHWLDKEIRLAMQQENSIDNGVTRAAIAHVRGLRVLSFLNGNEPGDLVVVPDTVIEAATRRLLPTDTVN